MKQRLILNLGQFHDMAPLLATQIIVTPVQRDFAAERVNSG